jgi:hypothetical protein
MKAAGSSVATWISASLLCELLIERSLGGAREVGARQYVL